MKNEDSDTARTFFCLLLRNYVNLPVSAHQNYEDEQEYEPFELKYCCEINTLMYCLFRPLYRTGFYVPKGDTMTYVLNCPVISLIL